MTAYNVVFERVGRDHHVPPQTFEADDADALAEAVFAFVKPRMMSREVKVTVDTKKGTGMIFAGFNNGGSFRFQEAGIVLTDFRDGER